MKKISKIIALFLAVLMCVSGLALSATAEPEDAPVENSGADSSAVTDGETPSEPETSEPDSTAYNVSISVGKGGLITAGGVAVYGGNSDNVSVNAGESLVLNIFPDKDFALESLTVNGTAVEVSGNGYTLSGVSADTQVVATFKSTIVVEYNLTIGASGNGTVAFDGTSVKDGTSQAIKVTSDKTVTITLTPEEGYAVKSLTVNGTEVSVENNSYVINGLTQDTTVVAVFAERLYNVTFNLTGKGSIQIMNKDTNEVLGEVSSDGTAPVSKTFQLKGYIKFQITTNGTYDIACGEPNNGNVGDLWFFSPITRDSENNIVFSEGGTGDTDDPDNPDTPDNPGDPGTLHTVQITVGSAGTVTAGEKTVNGGTGTNILVNSGDTLVLAVVPDEGYEVKTFTVNGVAIQLADNTYTLESIAANATVFVDFKVIGSTEEPDNVIDVEDIDWTADDVEVDVNGKEISVSVFDKIATSAPLADKFVTFVASDGRFSVPYGNAGSFSGETVKLSVLSLASGDDYSKLLALYGNDVNAFKAYSVQLSGVDSLPANTKITLDLGGFTVDGLKVYEYNGTLLIEKASGGATVSYDNEKILVCAASDGVKEATDESDDDSSVTVTVSGNDADTDPSEDSDEGGNGTLIVVLVIVLVAVLGAAALFIVKWRQEKF